jgi:hypothetical protein
MGVAGSSAISWPLPGSFSVVEKGFRAEQRIATYKRGPLGIFLCSFARCHQTLLTILNVHEGRMGQPAARDVREEELTTSKATVDAEIIFYFG